MFLLSGARSEVFCILIDWDAFQDQACSNLNVRSQGTQMCSFFSRCCVLLVRSKEFQ